MPTSTKAPTFTPTPGPVGFGIVSANGANLRSGPEQAYTLAGNARQGDKLPIYAQTEDGSWFQVDWNGSEWIASNLVKISDTIRKIPTIPTSTPTPTFTSTPTNTSIPTKTPKPIQTPRPSATLPPPVNLNFIYNNFETMTTLQFQEFKKEIAGEQVRQSVEVANVQDDGKVSLQGPWSPFIINISDYCVVVTGVPKDFALTLNGGDTFYLEATINGIVGNYGYYFNCKNTLVLNYRSAKK
jgi:hypothetical protein